MIEPDKVRLAYYESQESPYLMLFGPLDVNMGALQQCFYRLREGGLEIELHHQPFVHSENVKITLRSLGSLLIAKESDPLQSIRRIPHSQMLFTWSRSSQGWDHLAELLEGLILSTTACHQYLTQFPGEDAIVVASKGEYGDEALTQDRNR